MEHGKKNKHVKPEPAEYATFAMTDAAFKDGAGVTYTTRRGVEDSKEFVEDNKK
jgi:hypothetical protein